MRHNVVKTIPAHFAVKANLQAYLPTVSLIHIRSKEKQPILPICVCLNLYITFIFRRNMNNCLLPKEMQAYKCPQRVLILFILRCLWTVELNTHLCRGQLDWWVGEILIQHNVEYRVINHRNNWN